MSYTIGCFKYISKYLLIFNNLYLLLVQENQIILQNYWNPKNSAMGSSVLLASDKAWILDKKAVVVFALNSELGLAGSLSNVDGTVVYSCFCHH